MKLPLLSELFPNSPVLAQLYGGEINGSTFEKSFKAVTITEQLLLVNQYLFDQGFDFTLTEDEFNQDGYAVFCDLEFYLNPTSEKQIILCYSQPSMITPLDGIMKLLIKFREEREWNKFHTPKNLSMALSAETGELMDLFLWDRETNVDVSKVEEELADIFNYCLYLAHHYNINLIDVSASKIIKNDLKYPVVKSKGSANKYNNL